MGFDADRLMAATTRRRLEWSRRDAVLYAHGIGLAGDPLDETELRFVRDDAVTAFPTFPVALALTGGPLATAGLDMRGVLHGEHSLTLHAPIAAAGAAIMEAHMVGIWDKGAGKGAVFAEEKRLADEVSGEPFATIRTTVFGRAEGGFGGSRDGQPAPHAVPSRNPDDVHEIATRADQALLYRLSGDLNPIHIDPAAAARAGFDRPILHGLCTFALCARAIVGRVAGRAAGRLRHIQARFSAPVFPGDMLRISLWRDDAIVSFEAEVAGRARVITAGMAIIAAEDWS